MAIEKVKVTLLSVAVDGDINVLCGGLGGAENGDKRVGGGVERRADWANRRELLTRGDSPLSLSQPNMKDSLPGVRFLPTSPHSPFITNRTLPGEIISGYRVIS